MLSVSERVSRTNCVICNARSYSNVACDECRTQSRSDFYLLLLTHMKDENESYENLKSKCIDINDGINQHAVISEPRDIFDPFVDSVDSQSKRLLENFTDILNRDAVPVNVAGDGDCLFHTMHTFYPELSVDELRVRCISELCLNEQYYNSIINERKFDLVDDESVEEHVLRILNNGQYTGVLTLASLSSVLMRPIISIYPRVNDNDEYFEILNTTFFPRVPCTEAEEDKPLRIMWSGPEEEYDRDWRPNHFVPLLSPRQQGAISIPTEVIDHSGEARRCRSVKQYENSIGTTEVNDIGDEEETAVEEVIQNESVQVTPKSRQMFSSASFIINEILDAVKNNSADDQCPKHVIHSSKFLVKSTPENRVSIGKDGNGAWIQGSSAETALILTKNGSYQIVHHDVADQYFYLERVGRQYVQRHVEEKDVVVLKRFASQLAFSLLSTTLFPGFMLQIKPIRSFVA